MDYYIHYQYSDIVIYLPSWVDILSIDESLFVLTLNHDKIYNNENFKGKKYLEYWLSGITTGASGARQSVTISIK